MGYVCMVSYVVISTFPLIFLHQIFYKSAIVIEINMHQMVLGLPETSLPFRGSFLHFCFWKKTKSMKFEWKSSVPLTAQPEILF